MKNLFYIFLLSILPMVAFGQAESTLVKSIPMQTAATAVFELPGQVTQDTWDKDFIRITATIRVSNTSEELLKRLVTVGRYDMVSEIKDDKIVISMPKVAHLVTIKGVDLDENISFEVLLPNGVKATINTPEYLTQGNSL